MSRIGKLPVPVPAGVDIALEGDVLSVKGPKGSLTYTLPGGITLEREDNGPLQLLRSSDEAQQKALHGLSRSLVANMVTGVTTGFEKKLELVGVGYKVAAKGSDIEFALGYSHPILVSPPEGVKFVVVSPTKLTVQGIDKQVVGEVAANIRKLRKPEPYKGKGVRYEGEVVRRKAGKTGKKK